MQDIAMTILVELKVLEGIEDMAAGICCYGRLARDREEDAGVHWGNGAYEAYEAYGAYGAYGN